jgi:hypothetical protein
MEMEMEIVSGQWSVVSGQWSVVSGQWSVVSGQWSVVSRQIDIVLVQVFEQLEGQRIRLEPIQSWFRHNKNMIAQAHHTFPRSQAYQCLRGYRSISKLDFSELH